MSNAFTDITFTPSVKAAQADYGSRALLAAFDGSDEETASASPVELGEDESDFIHARDSFYQATVNEYGWPYVQYRGGPVGFLRVLDKRTLGYADFRGNRQYLSVGNLRADERVALILLDYAQRRRLKLWGRARIVHADEEAALLARLALPGYRARVERAIVITVAAYDWNCPQHITPRYTATELDGRLAALEQEITVLRARNAELQTRLASGG